MLALIKGNSISRFKRKWYIIEDLAENVDAAGAAYTDVSLLSPLGVLDGLAAIGDTNARLGLQAEDTGSAAV